MCFPILCFAAVLLFITSPIVTSISVRYKYVGCYEDRTDIPLFDKSVTVLDISFSNCDPCIKECNDRGYPFAGIRGSNCYCNHDSAPEIIKTSNSECDPSWLNKFSDNYPPRLAVYETGIAVKQIRPAKVYVGCFRDENKEFRLFKGFWQQFQLDNTPTKCHGICFSMGFKYFGLTYKEECFCGDARPSEDVRTDESDCNLPCTGNANLKCGGGWIQSVYSTGITDIPSDGRYVGCFKNTEEDKIFLSDYSVTLKSSNSPRRCLNICDQLGYKYAAVQNRDGCFCGNQVPPNSTADTAGQCNSIVCAGDPTETCGSKRHIKMYRTRKLESRNLKPIEYLGCYVDPIDYPVLEESRMTLSNSLTINLCIDICQQRGYPFAGIKFGKHCRCDYYYPSSLVTASADDCRTPCPGNPSDFCGGPERSSVYYTGISRTGTLPSYIYKGCFRDDNKANRLLKGSWQELENDSPRVCQRLCYKTGYYYFGLTWIKECFCGDDTISNELLVEETECNKPCGGDSGKICGGGWRLNVYHTGLSDIPPGNRYKGCYSGTSILNDFSSYVVSLSRTNSPQKCLNICDQLKYGYSGLEQGVNCRCSSVAPKEEFHESNDMCDTKCPGDETETCGRRNLIRVFETTVPESTTPLIEDPVLDRVGDKKCEDTYSTKNKNKVCRGEILFNEQFSDFNTSIWKHAVKIAEQPDFQFVMFTASSNITYIADGNLNIKPHGQPLDFISGSIDLKGCTGKAGSTECTKKAQGFNILPPIESARITTEDSFSFRYGIVDIRAKLPLGNWIIPEIWLMPKELTYGENYMSGQIRVAMARGNQDLLDKDNRNIGNEILEVGVYVGLVNDVKKKIFQKLIPKGWSEDFHNYTLVWTPDNLVFKVDGEIIGSLLSSPSETVVSVTNQPPNAAYIWNRGSILSPFDREFYINLGLSVGGIRDFPDNCISNGKKKPWANSAAKAMLNFWQACNQWLGTWSDNKTILKVDSIKIQAL